MHHTLLQKADSISQLLHNKDLTADVANAFGVIYEAQEKYKNAERYFLKAIETGSKESYKDSISLLHIYIKDNQLAKAHEWIETITKHNDIAYYFNQAYYLLYKAEGKYKEALHYKEICSDMLDSLTLVQNETKVLEIEKKYNNAKIREENELLKITQQGIQSSSLLPSPYSYYQLQDISFTGREAKPKSITSKQF